MMQMKLPLTPSIVFADIPCLKIKLYSVMFFLRMVSNNGLYDINQITSYRHLNMLNLLTILTN